MKRGYSVSYLSLIYLFLYLPIIILIIYSFNSSVYSVSWRGFTWQWYQQLLADTGLWRAARNSLILGGLAASFATIIGTTTVVSLQRFRFASINYLRSILFILILTPDIVMGVGLLLLYKYINLPLGFWSLLFAHITFCLPFVVLTISSRLRTIDNNLYEAAADLGANDFSLFKKILVPILAPAIIASVLLCFTLSFDDVIISYFVSGPGFEILPLRIFGMVKTGVKPEVNALSTVILCFTFILVTIAQSSLKKNA